jgi:hypothetical protein
MARPRPQGFSKASWVKLVNHPFFPVDKWAQIGCSMYAVSQFPSAIAPYELAQNW